MAIIIPIETKYNPRGVKTAIRDLDEFKSAVAKAGGGFKGLALVTGKVMQQVGADITKTGRTMSRNITAPIIGLGIAAGVAFDRVDSGMDTVAAKSGLTGDALKDMQEVFKRVAASSTQDMESIGEVVGVVAGKFNLAGKDAERFATQLLDLSRVTGVDAATTTESVGQALTALGLDARKAGGFLDTLLTASQKSNVGIDELAGTVAKAAPTFRTYGIGAKDSVALIASLAGAGLPATRVVAGLNTAFKKLTEKGVKDLPKGLKDVLTQIRDIKDPTKATALAVEIFGSRVGVTLADAVRTGRVSIDDLAKSLEGSQGALKRTADAVEGPQEQFARMKNQLMLMGATFMEQVIPILDQYVIPVVKQVIDWFNQMDPSMKKIVVIAGLLAAAIGPVLVVLGGLITGLGSLITVVGAISAPVAAVVAGIAAFVAIVVALWAKSEAFRDAVMDVWESVRGAIEDAIDAVKKKLDENREQLDKLRDAFGKVWEFLERYIFPALAKFYGEYLKGLIKVLGFAIGSIIDFISGLVDLGSALINAGRNVWKWAQDVRDRVIDVVRYFRDLPGNIRTAIGNALTMLYSTGQNIVLGLRNGLTNAGRSFVSWVTGWIKSILPDPIERFLGISSPSKLFADMGMDVVDGLVKGLDDGKGKVSKKALDLIQAAYDKFKERVEEARQFGQEIADSLFGNLNLSKAMDDAKANGTTLVQAFYDQGQKIKEFAQKMLKLKEAGLSQVAFTDIFKLGYERGTELADALIDGNIYENVRRVNEVYKSIQDISNEVGTKAAVDFFNVGVSSALATLRGLISELLPAGKTRRTLLKLMDDLAQSMGRTTYVDVITRRREEGAPAPAPAPAPVGPSGGGYIDRLNQELAAMTPEQFSSIYTGPHWSTLPTDFNQIGLGLNIPMFADGGVVNRPTVGIFGEAGPEAIIPLRGAGRAAGIVIEQGAIQVNVNGGSATDVRAAVDAAFDDLVRELRAI